MKKSTWILIGIIVGFIFGGLMYRHYAQDIDSRGATRLMRALEDNDSSKVERLLKEGNVDVRDKSGQTALFYAAHHTTDPHIIYKLILAGADPLAVDKHNNTPLMIAAQYNPNVRVIRALAKLGNSKKEQFNRDRSLVFASRHNTGEVIKALLIAKASPAAIDPAQPAWAYLDENPQLNEREKMDLRQVMLLLEILEAREKFIPITKKEVRAAEPLTPKVKQMALPVPAPAAKKESASASSSASVSTALQTKQPDKKGTVPQEKQMSKEETKL